MHGEQHVFFVQAIFVSGSSPYARGTAVTYASDVDIIRIIPVCTGNRWAGRINWVIQRDHPRMHGEQDAIHVYNEDGTGSSPYARGTVLLTPCEESPSGIIPVCTGNSQHYQ